MTDPFHGRGARLNPANRFVPLHLAPDPDLPPDESPAPETIFFKDAARSLIAYNDSPDVGFSASINPYRGCEHGCIYCYARPNHEYLDFSAGVDFETRILAKEDAPEILRRELLSPRWRPQTLAMSGVTDSYQPVERKMLLTRRCLEVLAEFRNPVGIVTKNHLVTRDIDVLGQLARYQAGAVFVSVTTLDADLAGKMEPRASRPAARLEAIRELSAAGIPVGVMMAPIIPGLTDHEIPAVLEAARAAGALSAGKVLLRLPFAVKDLFTDWLGRHYPLKKERILGRVRSTRSGQLNNSSFGSRMKGEGFWADSIQTLFEKTRERLGFPGMPELSTASFERPGMTPLFDDL
jgi:DNA repair photolyase